jgi:hypothetical protein
VRRGAKRYDFEGHAAALDELIKFYRDRLNLCIDALAAAEDEDADAYEEAIVLMAQQEAPEDHDYEVTAEYDDVPPVQTPAGKKYLC